ncbi:MAG: glycerol kinase GlpK [Actinobacteria bacterium]|nr:MAG: glycerol kinase GlpK [Actinomycetota bacterium]
MSKEACVLAIDAGTTSVRTLAIDSSGRVRTSAARELTQYFPRPGWVEHDADEIWRTTVETLRDVTDTLGRDGTGVAAIGITNQRETIVVWDPTTGRPRGRAIVWQDRRTAGRCDELRALGYEPLVRERTGLVLDPYFSATKLEWLVREDGLAPSARVAAGTVDSWLLWNLTGGPDGGVHATDPSNASRTMLFDLDALAWSDELCALFSVPMRWLPEVRPSCARLGVTDPDRAAGVRVPVSGIAGDQQAALFGQACFTPGMSKNTYGTGSFVLVNLGPAHPPPAPGLLTTVAWSLGDLSAVTYALEGAIFITGAAIQWLRDGLGIIDDAAAAGPLAASVPDTDGVVFVPAFTGLGSPWWDPYARGTIMGLTRGTTRAHLVRAVIESMAWQTRDVIDTMTQVSGNAVTELRVDGGASVMDVLCQFQSDVLGVPVRRPVTRETTALGAAYLAGIAEGVWPSPREAAASWQEDARFEPAMAAADVAHRFEEWHRAVERSRGWAAP